MDSQSKIECGVEIIVDMYLDNFKKSQYRTVNKKYKELLKHENTNGLTDNEIDILANCLASDVSLLHDQLTSITSITTDQLHKLMEDIQNRYFSTVVDSAKKHKSTLSFHTYGVLVKGRIVHIDNFHRNLADGKTYTLPYLKDKCMNEDCSICGEEFHERSIVCVVKCKHAFHPTCIHRWSMESSTCPYCRSEIVVSSLIDYQYESSFKKNGEAIAKINLTTV
ncbi:hypothetical protein HELRODRAFT_177646 [Helobdella robusta]|uniref:RING-type domain-containing protein n=1 Tax=Helobdella robusta TaxID=6412 RepID=T1FC02_HELRO|nr:hypothetical protein HELRODRAFT_177646 [Helobdella robusta]ESN97975.1 hypothetical protein HELRODRAFT_177646 [Helobdella robusta]